MTNMQAAPQNPHEDFRTLNARLNIAAPDGTLQLESDQEAARQYFLQEVNNNTVFFHNLREKLNYLVREGYYENEVLGQYDFEFVKSLFKRAYSYHFRFKSFLGAYKYYSSYTLKTFSGDRYLERYEDRVAMVALYLARGQEELAEKFVDEIITGRFQPATPTFLNAGKAQRGELVSCFLLRTEDNLESISRNITNALQLSKRGGGVALNLSNLRESGAPIKKIENQSSGVVPVMKLLEDSFSYANQLGARQGAGAVYLHAHHPDIMRFLDTKRENADEKIRIKTLSTGVVISDITMKLVRNNEDMYLFSPYDVEREYGRAFTEVSVTDEYYRMVENPNIRKSKISARKLLQTIAELQFESGYPYILFEDNANRNNPIDGRITMSNLCSEILQVSQPSTYDENGYYDQIGKDISCNLGSMNVAAAFDSSDFSGTIETAIRALTSVSDLSNISSVPSIEKGNDLSHAIGLGQMNLHGFLGREHIHYDSPEAVDFTNLYFYAVLYQCLKASNKIARETGETFKGFEKSKYASGEFFEKYIERDWSTPETSKVARLLNRSTIYLPTPDDWRKLREDVANYGLYHQNLQAVPPTGSISYINHSTSSIHPIANRIEARKEGRIGKVYFAPPEMTNDNVEYFNDAYETGPEAILNVYQAATNHIDQGLSLTLFYTDKANTGTLIKNYVSAWSKGIKTLYYVRIQRSVLAGTEVAGVGAGRAMKPTTPVAQPIAPHDEDDSDECESCML